MVRKEITDGKRIGQLFASEIHGHERGPLGRLAVADADRDVEPTAEGAFAYRVVIEREETTGDRIASAYIQPDRLRLEFETGLETARAGADRANLRVRSAEIEPPRTLVFVENGADVKAALDVVRLVTKERLEQVE